MLNRKQKRSLFVGMIALWAVVVFPPWAFHASGGEPLAKDVFMGFSSLLHERDRPIDIHMGFLIVEMVLVCLTTAVSIVLFQVADQRE